MQDAISNNQFNRKKSQIPNPKFQTNRRRKRLKIN